MIPVTFRLQLLGNGQVVNLTRSETMPGVPMVGAMVRIIELAASPNNTVKIDVAVDAVVWTLVHPIGAHVTLRAMLANWPELLTFAQQAGWALES